MPAPAVSRRLLHDAARFQREAPCRVGRRGCVQPGCGDCRARECGFGRMGRRRAKGHGKDLAAERMGYAHRLHALPRWLRRIAMSLPHQPAVRQDMSARRGRGALSDVPHDGSRGRGEPSARTARRAAPRGHRSLRVHSQVPEGRADAHRPFVERVHFPRRVLRRGSEDDVRSRGQVGRAPFARRSAPSRVARRVPFPRCVQSAGRHRGHL